MMRKLFALLFITSTFSLAAENLLKNPGFEKLDNGRPKHWFLISGEGAGVLKVVNDNDSKVLEVDVKQTGAKVPSAMSGDWQAKNMLDIKPGCPIEADVKAKSLNNGNGFLKLIFRTADGKWLSYHDSQMFTATNQWQTYSLKSIAPKKAVKAQLHLCVKQGTVLFDDATVKSLSTSSIQPGKRSAEFWINLDYNDNVSLCDKLGLKNYKEKEIAKFFRDCKRFNVDGVLWRVSATGQFMHHSKVGTRYPGKAKLDSLSPAQKRRALIMKEFDPLRVAIREARKNQIKIMIWMTISDEYSTDKKNPLQGTSDLVLQHPEYALINKQGEPLKGTLCYNVPEVLQYRLATIKELLTYNADGIYMCTRTHAFYHGKDNDMDYGYNEPIVREFQKRYGVNILKEPFDKQKWLELRAEGLTELVKQAEKLVHGQKQQLWLGLKTAGNEKRGWPYGSALFPWKNWVKQGWIDTLVVGHYFIPYSRIVADTQTFRSIAGPTQKILFWQQFWHYQKQQIISLKELIDQVKLISFAGADGAVYHEGFNLEERIDSYWLPLSQAINKYWHHQKNR